MKRGRTILLLLLILVIAAAAVLVFMNRRGGGGAAQATPTPLVRYIDVIVAGQAIPRASIIKEDVLGTIQIPEDKIVEGMLIDSTEVIGKLAKYPLEQGVPITRAMLADSVLQIAQGGSEAARLVPPGMTAISIPISRLSSSAFAIRDGDHVNVIASILFVDYDQLTQTSAPLMLDNPSMETPPDVAVITVDGAKYGRTEVDPVLNLPFYVVPGESQRPRLASQMVLQDIRVLHVGNFKLPEEEAVDAQLALQPTPTPQPGAPAVNPAAGVQPDIITLVVTPQDAVTLTYLIFSNSRLTLTLRGADDLSRVETEAATLGFILSQYGIPVPAKLPYGTTPRIDELVQPFMPNDIVIDTSGR
jgi:Flp pilus assembly protein CpaB